MSKRSSGPASASRAPDSAAGSTGPGRVIPRALAAALQAASDPDDRARLEDLFLAAALAIDALGEIDLSDYEPTGEEGADLSAWEQMAPIVGATVGQVNTLLATIDERIPAPEEEDDLDDLDLFGDAFSENDGGGPVEAAPDSPEARTRAAMSAIHGIASVLRMEVGAFGQAMRKPQVMANRWNLLDTLEAFRGKFRAGIGEMVFAAAQSLADVDKEAVVPGYRQDIDRSVGLRRAVALLAPSISKENGVAQAASAGDGYTIRRQTARVAKLLERFTSSRAFRHMRAADRKSVCTLQAAIAAHLADGSAWPAEMRKTIEGLDRFLESMSVINHRETLVVHDREALPQFRETIEAAKAAAAEDDGTSARLLFSDAMETGWRLVGRDPELDDVLLRARRVDMGELDSEDVDFWAEAIMERLRLVPLP